MIDFRGIAEPRIHLFIGDQSQFCDATWKLSGELPPTYELKTLQGNRMRTELGLFHEFAAALQFPYYFGNNWNALDECLLDLEWLPADGYLLFLSDAPQVLAEDQDAAGVLMRVLLKASEYWTRPMACDFSEMRDRQPRPFHIIFNCQRGEEAAMEERLSGLPYSRVELAK